MPLNNLISNIWTAHNKLADYLNLKAGTETYIHPEGKKLIIEN